MSTVRVFNNDVVTALRKLKKILGREGVTRDVKKNEYFMKPSEKHRQAERRSVRRRAKAARE